MGKFVERNRVLVRLRELLTNLAKENWRSGEYVCGFKVEFGIGDMVNVSSNCVADSLGSFVFSNVLSSYCVPAGECVTSVLQ